ncbi:MAG TPA: peptidylprolyl isomerase [Gemmatimonadales bacterium]|nr:peptidylprolyl isomerase [Gemmatimonadales bacterium]
MRRMLVAAGLLTALVACNKQDQGGVQSAPTDPTALLNPAALNAQAPAAYRAKFETSAGDFTIEVTRAWAPLGADRLYNLIKNGFYDGDRFFRVVPGFVVQFGLNGNPTVSAAWRHATIQDDPVTQHNATGTLVFATAGPDTRTTQLFINYADNLTLDTRGFAPLGTVVEGMDVVQKIFPGYAQQPDQGMIESQGNDYLSQAFPKLDFIKKASIQ